MQILPSDLRVGSIVLVRRGRWRIVDVRSYESCQIVTLTGLAPANDGATRHVIAPFDRVDALDRPARPRIARAGAWRRTCRRLIAVDCPPGCLRSAAAARIDMLPFQLEPAMAVVRGEASRVLLADEVGLGKTIQAGLVIGELLVRRAIDRVLILTPAGLRDQWRDELARRFRLDAAVVDARTIARRSAALPADVNPWTTIPVAIASIELVKRPDVLAAACAPHWDLVVVDEAHGAATDSERHSAARAVAARSAYVLLITATPHSGDQRAYESLCNIGTNDSSGDDKLLVFRRSRRDVGLGGQRRVHVIPVRRSADERKMDAALAAYSTAVQRERGEAWLALSVLHKRALSSAWSLAESVDRRLAAIGGDDEPMAGEQLLLPLVDRDGDFSPDDRAPRWPSGVSLSDSAAERRLLTDLAAASRRAAVHESKVAAIVRLLRRIDERLIVFTEYRDTLEHVRRVIGPRTIALHGGMTRDERSTAIARFTREPGTVLLATDAAGEGLNLHEACRLVINLELPWNPMRLEQRIGRVDRIGQQRRVHACHLVAAATGEGRILQRLRDRVAFARSTIGAPDPLGIDTSDDDERAIARLVVAGESGETKPERATMALSSCTATPEVAIEESRRIEERRRLGIIAAAGADRGRRDGPLILIARRSPTRQRLGSALLTLWRLAAEDSSGHIVECRLVAVLVRGDFPRERWTRGRVARLIESVDAEMRASIDAATTAWRARAAECDHAFRGRRVLRERAIAERIAFTRPGAYQAGLFDRRAEREHRIAAAMDAARAAETRDRLTVIDRPIVAWPLDLALVAACP